jgi:predicted kinase
VICGPCGSGKTTLVNREKAPSDLVVDVDALFVALSGQPWFETPDVLLPFVLDARDALFERIARGDVRCKAWVITAHGDMAKVLAIAQRLRASIVVLAVDRAVCEERIRSDSLRKPERIEKLYIPLAKAWWDDFERTRHLLPPDAEILT